MRPSRIRLELAVCFGSAERRIALDDLATVLGLDPVVVSRRLTTLLCGYPHPVDKPAPRLGGRGTIGGEGPLLSAETNDRSIQSITSTPSIGDSTMCVTETFVEGEGGSREEEGPGRDDPLTARLATYLADRLDDPGSLAFYALVVRRVPWRLIREAFIAAHKLAPHQIRRSRAAYFTAIVRPHLARHPHVHA